jgi:hypothetical protein
VSIVCAHQAPADPLRRGGSPHPYFFSIPQEARIVGRRLTSTNAASTKPLVLDTTSESSGLPQGRQARRSA